MGSQIFKNKYYGLETIAPLNKGLGCLEKPLKQEDVVSLGWNLLREDLSLPSAVLYKEKLLHNLHWMQQFVKAYGVKLAPHGKTTMAPKLFRMQLENGAWGITLATAHQTLAAYQHGVRRVLMANQLVGKENMAIISRLLQDSRFEYFCLVDSPVQVDQLGAFFSERKQRLNVLIELGVIGGRSGVRDEEQVQSVISAISRWKGSIALSGVELYEGVLDDEAEVRAFLERAVSVTGKLIEENRFEHAPILLSGAGSAWYDIVADVFCLAGFGDAVEIILRPGCYLTHDIGAYRKTQARILANNPVAKRMHSNLQPALQVWAYVQSIPEPERAIIGMGKRDAAFDADYPVPALKYRPKSAGPQSAPDHWVIEKMMDQHAYLKIAAQDDLRVGDMIGFDISHPCLTFDKWRVLPVLNAEYEMVDLVQTFF